MVGTRSQPGSARKNPYAVSSASQHIVPYLVKKGEYAEALSLGIEQGNLAAALLIRSRIGEPERARTLDLDELVGDRKEEVTRLGELFAVSCSLIPIGFALALSRIKGEANDSASSMHEELRGICEERGDSDVFVEAEEIIAELSSSEETESKLDRRTQLFRERQWTPLSILALLVDSLRSELDIIPALARHVQACFLLDTSMQLADSYVFREFVEPFIVEYWSQRFRRERFKFRAPQLVSDALQSSLREPPGKKARAVLRAIHSAFRIDTPPKLQEWLNRQS